MLAFITAAAVWRRRSGVVARVDFSMIEAMLWTMAEPLLAEQLPDAPRAPASGAVYPCSGSDDWIAADPAPAASLPPAASQPRHDALSSLNRAGVACSSLARSADLVASEHLRARGFWDEHGAGVVPGLPWRASFGRANGPAPALGADTNNVLQTVLGLSTQDVERLRDGGALG